MYRPEVIAATTLITETIVATPAQANLLRVNPHTRLMRDVVPLPDGRVRVTIDRVDPRALTSAPTRARRIPHVRMPFALAMDPGAARALRRTSKIAGVALLAIAVLAGTGWTAWVLWGDQITAAVKILLAVAGVFALVVAVGSVVTIARKGGCTGLHCPGCSHH